jgi:DNA helicase-2/ATP-dependent DNA helicase PcrA
MISEEQAAACATLSGPVRVVAGAGTGKTTIIAERVRRLLESGVEPNSILVMTFTERAAGEMRERIEAVSGCQPPSTGTFHSLALRWLREQPQGGLPSHFRILAGAERWIFLRELMWELGHPALVGSERPDELVQPLLKLQERLKQELVPADRLADWARHQPDSERRDLNLAAAQLFALHSRRCQDEALADFDDLLLRAVRLLERNVGVRDHLCQRYPWILVDEYQDCNAAQERLVELLGAPQGNVCVVGDDDQSIYRFRGAARASMERFPARFPAARTLTLGVNRRSTERVVAAAKSLIEHDEQRLAKPVRAAPEAPLGASVEIWQYPSHWAEAQAVSEQISRLAERGIQLRNIAILNRTHAIAGSFLKALEETHIPAQHWAGRGFFQRPEIKDLIAYMQLLHDPGCWVPLVRLLARPPLNLDVDQAMPHARVAKEPLCGLQSWAPTSNWAATLLDLIPLRATLGVDELLYEMLSRTRHLEAIVPQEGAERQRVLANVERFSELVNEYCGRRSDHSLGPFVEHLGLILRSGVDEEEAAEELEDSVQVMSIHQAKGLEFEAVFVPALVEGRLPQPHRVDSLELTPSLVDSHLPARADHLAEERRLLYVAMTRARSYLTLSWAERYEGSRRWKPSRFLAELGLGEGNKTPSPLCGGGGPARGRRGWLGAITSSKRRDGSVPPPPALRATSPAEGGGVKPILSFSAISTYRDCPRQYWFRYHLRLPVKPTVEAQLGIVVHDTLLRAGRMLQEGKPVEEPQLTQLYRQAWQEVVLVEPRQRPALDAHGWRLLRAFWVAGGLRLSPYMLERPFSAELETWHLSGIIDRVDQPNGNGCWRIIDYKTGRPLPASKMRRDLQLALYALGAQAALGLNPVELEIAYLRNGHRERLEASEELLANARRIGDEVAEGVQSGRFVPRPERRKCGRCSYRLACDAAL